MGEGYYVGIDLGTVYSCLAYADGKGNVETVPDTDGEDLVPSVVLFTERGKVVGHRAKAMARDYSSSNVVSGFKKQMGTNFKRQVMSSEYTPTEISAIVMRKMIADFERRHGAEVKSLVVTVPGEYGGAERRATEEAARIVGIENVELLNEPVAAALSYGIGRGQKCDRTIIVYDLGGGTFDATVLRISDGEYRTLSSEGSRNIGGRDWDLQLASIIQKKVLDTAGLTPDDIETDSRFRMAVLAEAERQKIALSASDRAMGAMEVNGTRVPFTVTREELEESTAWLMASTVEIVGNAVRNAKLQTDDVDELILVGGGSLMPQVIRSLEDAFPSMDVEFFDPAHAVARGAALYAESRFGGCRLKVTSVLGNTFGIMAGIDGVESICNVLYKNIPLPMERVLMCRPKRDDQQELEISVYESSARAGQEYISPEMAWLVSTFRIPLNGKISRGRTRIAVKFSADVEGKVSISVDVGGAVTDCNLARDVELTSAQLMEAKMKVKSVMRWPTTTRGSCTARGGTSSSAGPRAR